METQHETRHRQENELRAEIRKIVNEELDRRALENLQTICPPKLLRALQAEFPGLLSDSREEQTVQDCPAGFYPKP